MILYLAWKVLKLQEGCCVDYICFNCSFNNRTTDGTVPFEKKVTFKSISFYWNLCSM